jgi:molecular chaperone GrpE
MVDNNDKKDVDVDVEMEEDAHTEDVELEEIEDRGDAKVKKLREKLKLAEEEKRKAQDDLQLARADFLNARRRLEEDRARDRIRSKKQFVEDLLPLCDSFHLAMSDTEAWEKAEASWRKGIEGIHSQLQAILREYGVSVMQAAGAAFDPNRHEAVGTEEVTDPKLDDTVVSVMQNGYEITFDGKTEIIRPARVTTGVYND